MGPLLMKSFFESVSIHWERESMGERVRPSSTPAHQPAREPKTRPYLDILKNGVYARSSVENVGGDENIVAVGLKTVLLGCLFSIQDLVLDNAFIVGEKLASSREETSTNLDDLHVGIQTTKLAHVRGNLRDAANVTAFQRFLAQAIDVLLSSLWQVSRPIWNVAQVSLATFADGYVRQLGRDNSPGLENHVIFVVLLKNANVKGKCTLSSSSVTCHLFNGLGLVLLCDNHLFDESRYHRRLIILIKNKNTHHAVVEDSVHDTGMDNVVLLTSTGTGTSHKRRVCDTRPSSDLDIIQVVKRRTPVDPNVPCSVVELVGWDVLGMRGQRDPGGHKAVLLNGL
ncbi:hypothetical protein HG531_005712 [Fusarium graminearum]|nr:hypothetical protein HG531_005712 [Fusarium graminearum]